MFTVSRFSRLILTLAGVATFALGQARAEQKLPNILWITSEDNGAHLGCYGDTYATSPNIDRLAKRSLRYTNASSTAPVCAPARTTIISGIYPPATGAEHMRSMTRLPKGFKMYPAYLRELGYYCTNNSKEDYNLRKEGEVWHASSRDAHWSNRPEGKPFFAVFNHTISHESQIRNRIAPENQIHDPAKVRIPAYHPDTPEVRKDWAQYYDRITMMDKLVGRTLKEVSDAGLADDTIVFYYGDHGSGMPRNKRWPYFSGLNVPLIVHVPHMKPVRIKARRSLIDLVPTMLELLGLPLPTAEGDDFVSGVSLVPDLFPTPGIPATARDICMDMPGGPYIEARRAFIHNDLKLIVSRGAHKELFDLSADPEEKRNLWGTRRGEIEDRYAAFKATLKEFKVPRTRR